MEKNILKKKFVDTDIKLIRTKDFYRYEVLQVCCTPIAADVGLVFVCEVRKKTDPEADSWLNTFGQNNV